MFPGSKPSLVRTGMVNLIRTGGPQTTAIGLAAYGAMSVGLLTRERRGP
jgi:hypothetical protein